LETHNDLAEYQIRAKNGTWSRERLGMLPDGQRWTRIIEGCLTPDFRSRLQTVDDVIRLMPEAPRPQVYQPPRPVQAPPPVATPQVQRQAPGFYLRVMQGEEYGRVYALSQMLRQGQRVFSIGRHPGNDIYIKSDFTDFLSRRHCTLEVGDGKWMVRDGQWHHEIRKWVDSRNGTFVNSCPVTPHGYYLSSGDIIAIGDVTIRFEFC
jgi:hypothetical protein